MEWCATVGCVKRAPAGRTKCHACLKREWREQNPEKQAQRAEAESQSLNHIRKYGVTADWYEQKVREQGGLCAICGKTESAKHRGKLVRLSVDHNHKTRKPRGLLCAACNRAIGLMKEDPQRLEAAARYLRQHQYESAGTSEGTECAETAASVAPLQAPLR
jgi:hypothetical protein